MKRFVTKVALAGLLLSPLSSFASENEKVDNLLVILTSGDALTQFMAMVLANQSQEKGAHVDVVLCGKAGELAIKGANEVKMKPKDISAGMLMSKLIKGGAKVELCPPYLPNSGKTKADLKESIEIAKPPMVADKILSKNTKILSY